jgi:NAD(P)-dependent dehydrogenase (short-subunit alcohol dehydrogenase family)
MINSIAVRRGLSESEANKYWDKVNSRNPTGRLGTAEEVAEACVFLTSHRSTFINGQTLSVDGGMGVFYSYQVQV